MPVNPSDPQRRDLSSPPEITWRWALLLLASSTIVTGVLNALIGESSLLLGPILTGILILPIWIWTDQKSKRS